MSELHKNKNLKSNKNENESKETIINSVGLRRDILFYIKSDYADLEDEHSKKIKQTYDFIDFVYGKSNTERLSKIIDEVVKKDMEFVNDKTYKEITDWQKQKNPNYRFEDSLYGQMRQRNRTNLAELMLWHMTLLDILNLKCCDLNLNEPLEKSIENAMTQKSSNRLDFLCGNHGLDHDYVNYYGKTLYEYGERIFEELPKEQQRLYEDEDDDDNSQQKQKQEQLMGKIFACFIKVAFCNMSNMEKSEYYENYYMPYLDHRSAVINLIQYFYCGGSLKVTEKDMATYLFLTGELEIMFERYNRDFFSFLCNHKSNLTEFWFFLNEIKPLEKRFSENKDRFIKMFFSRFFIYKTKMDYDLKEAIADILPYFPNDELRSSLIADIAREWKTNYNELSKSLSSMEKSNKGSRYYRDRQLKLKLPEQTGYFRDIIERFTDDQEYSNLLVEGMSAMFCRNKNNVIDNQKNDQKNSDNKMIENSNIIKSADNIVQEEKEKNELEGTKKKEEEKAEPPRKETVENKNLKEDEKKNPIKINQIKLKKNKQAMTEVKNETKNNPQNWFVRFVYKVLNFFCSVGSKIRNFFCGQPKKIDIVDLKNNSVVQDINILKGKDSETPKVDNLNNEQEKNA